MENINYFKHTDGSLGDQLFSRLKNKKDDDRKDYLDTFLQNLVVNFILASRDTLKELILVKLRRLVQLDVRWSRIMKKIILNLEKHSRHMGLARTLPLLKNQQLAMILLDRYCRNSKSLMA